MPANTTRGFPYPLGTDRVADGDDAIHNLATAVDTKVGLVQSGSVVVNVATGGTSAGTAVTFPTAFPGIPNVITGLQGGSASTTSAVSVSGVSATGCTVNAVRATAGPLTCYWIATY